MDDHPLVSVIIPAFNAGKYIRQCLESVFAQTYRPLEVIVVDDGSTDNTLAILEDFELKIIRQDKKGACAARNIGFNKSKGEYIQFLDADDLISSDKIGLQVAQLKGQPESISNGRWGRFYTHDPFREKIKWGPDKSLQKDLDPVTWLCQNHMSQTACWLTPRDLIHKSGPWDETLEINQDGEFFTRVLGMSKQVFYCENALVYYRSSLHGSVSSKAKSPKALESLFRTCESFEQVLLILEDSDRTRLACANQYQIFVYRAYPGMKDLIKKAEERIGQFGGSSWPPDQGNRIYNFLMHHFGWKFPAYLKYLIR